MRRGNGTSSLAGVVRDSITLFVLEPARFIMQGGMGLGLRDGARAMMDPDGNQT